MYLAQMNCSILTPSQSMPVASSPLFSSIRSLNGHYEY